MNEIRPDKKRTLFATVAEQQLSKLRNLLIMESTIWTEYPEIPVLVQCVGLVTLQYWNCWPGLKLSVMYSPAVM
jgi:hypothetical protein